MTGPTVVPFTGGNLLDIPGGLRRLADSIEAQEITPTQFAWVGVSGKGVAVGAFGASITKFHAAGLLMAGASEMAKDFDE